MTTETIVDRFSRERIPVRPLTYDEMLHTAESMRKVVFHDIWIDDEWIRDSMTEAMVEWLNGQSETTRFEMAIYIGGLEG